MRRNKMKRMKKLPTLFVMVLLMIALTACGTSTPGSSASEGSASEQPVADDTVYEFSLAHQWAANSYQETELIQRWIQEVDEATAGHVKIKSYPANALTSGPENYEGVVQGIADIGMMPYGYSAGRFPVVEAFTLPGLASFNNAAAASYAVNDAIATLDPEELHDTQHLFTFSTGASALLSNVPVQKIEDFKGLSLGCTQGERARMLELLGATPVSLPITEWYESLQKNLIVGGIMSPEALAGGTRLAEVTGSYITNSGLFACSMFYCVMNLDKFNALPPEYQEVLTQIPDYFATAWDSFAVNGVVFAKEMKDVEIITLTDEETQRWRDAMAPIIEDSKKSLDDRGLSGEEIHKLVKDMEAKYNAEYPQNLREMIEKNT